jgi:predicted TIM-barrel fold metal-dependent hydrolase
MIWEDQMDDKLTIVSVDGHAQMPPEAWPKYLDKRYHEHLPALADENRSYTQITAHFTQRLHKTDLLDVFDVDNALRDGGGYGVWDRKIRIQEMDREGIAGEFIHSGDARAAGLFYQSSNWTHTMDLAQAGVKAYNRWLSDEFAPESDRLFLIGNIGSAPWRDMDELLAELDWIADHGFKATSVPGYVAYPGQPPLFDRYWDPFWARCQERNITLWMHAGQGEGQGELGAIFRRIGGQIDEEQGDVGKAVDRLAKEFFKGKIFSSIKPRRATWQIMMGGVFDRFPKLRLMLSEIYGDWLGPTFKYLDEQFELNRDKIVAQRKPSEYYKAHCMNGLSFIRRCEVDLRHDLGVERLAFGRDYPHGEGTWPNTIPWLRDALGGVPQDEAIGIMGGNAIRFLGLDKAKLDAIAQRIGPSMDAIFGQHPPLPADLVAHFDSRAQYLGQPERETRIPEMDRAMQEDLWRARALA